MTAEPDTWSIDDAGFLTIEVFDRGQKNEIVSLLTKQFGTSPESKPGPKALTTRPQIVPTIDITQWNINNTTIGRVFSDPGNTFHVDMAKQLSLYQSVRVLLIDNPIMPFLLLLIVGDIHPEKLDRASLQFSIRDQLHRLSLPFRLFLEKTPGLSSQGLIWSPHVANLTWGGVTISAERLLRIHDGLSQLRRVRASMVGTIEEQDQIEGQIMQATPLDLASPSVKVTSHIVAFSNLHIVLSEADHPGWSNRSLSMLYITTDRGLIDSYPDWKNVFIPQFPSSVQWTPGFGESMLAWLLALNIWATHRQLTASNLDQRAMALRQSLDTRSAHNEIGRILSDVSLLGTDAAAASGEVNLVKRRANALLNELVKGGPLSQEIPLRIHDPILSRFVPNPASGIVSKLASMTRESLEAAAEHLRQVETEVANFQRHLSDIAFLQAREASTSLERSIARWTIILVALTAVLAAISFSDKLPPDLQFLPWQILGLVGLAFAVIYKARLIRHPKPSGSNRSSKRGGQL